MENVIDGFIDRVWQEGIAEIYRNTQNLLLTAKHTRGG